MGQAGSNNILTRGHPVLAFGPEHAATVANEGWTREGIQTYLWENARYPADKLSPEFLDAVAARLQGGSGEIDITQPLAIADQPEDIHIIVAGGSGKHSSWLPSFGGMSIPATIPLD